MSGLLVAALDDYLALRRSLGFKLARAAKLLAQFVAYCDTHGAEFVTTELALAWAARSPSAAGANWEADRLSVVRGFARYMVFVDHRTEVPPGDLLPVGPRRASPYLYSKHEVVAIMAAAGRFPSMLRKATLSTIVGLLYASGMRVGEVLRLDRDDVDLATPLTYCAPVEVRQVPPAPAASLNRRRPGLICRPPRRSLFPHPCSAAFFVSLAGTRILYCNFHSAFLAMVAGAGLRAAPKRAAAPP